MIKIILPTISLFLLTNSLSLILLSSSSILIFFILKATKQIPSILNPLFLSENISNSIIILSIITFILIILSSIDLNKFLFLSTTILFSLILIFTSSNLFLFYISFEIVLIPTLILITKIGRQPERIQAGIYLLIYTILGSLPLLIRIIRLNPYSNFPLNSNIPISFNLPILIILAFLIKLPIFFFHLWLPKAHVEAPVEGSIILAAILLKIGGYGIIRFLPILFKFCNPINSWLIRISLLGAFLTRINCTRQKDLKSLIAYSSVAHIGLVLARLLTITNIGLNGAIIIIIGHGLSSSALFFLVNLIYSKHHSRNIISFKGLFHIFPNLTFWWFIFISINISAPPSINFFSEILIIRRLVPWNNLSIILIFLASFSTASFSIILFTNISHNINSTLPISNFTQKQFNSLFLHSFPLIIISLQIPTFLILLNSLP